MRRKQSLLRALLLISGAAVLGYAGVRALLDLQPGADVDFFRWTGPTAKGIDVGSAKVDLPILYYRDDAFMGVFTAAREPVQALLPSRRLYPVLASAERAMLVVVAFNYFETSGGPNGRRAGSLARTSHLFREQSAPHELPGTARGRLADWEWHGGKWRQAVQTSFYRSRHAVESLRG
jgi:hypothetical protein